MPGIRSVGTHQEEEARDPGRLRSRTRFGKDVVPLDESRVTWARDGRWGFDRAGAERVFQREPAHPPVGSPSQDAVVGGRQQLGPAGCGPEDVLKPEARLGLVHMLRVENPRRNDTQNCRQDGGDERRHVRVLEPRERADRHVMRQNEATGKRDDGCREAANAGSGTQPRLELGR